MIEATEATTPSYRHALDSQSLSAVIAEIVCAELRGGRPEKFHALSPQAVARSERWIEDFALDSLERTSIARTVAEFFNVFESQREDTLLIRPGIARWVEIVTQSRSEGAIDITFRSSGSSGTPKRFRHNGTWLEAEARHWAAQVLRLFDAPRAIYCAVPRTHIYGFLWGVLLPQFLKLPVYDAQRATAHDAADLSQSLLIATPRQYLTWERLLIGLPNVLAISSTNAFNDVDAHRIRSSSKLYGLWEIYGSSETGGLGMRDSADDYRWLPYLAPEINGLDVASVLRTHTDASVSQLQLPDHVRVDPERAQTHFVIGARRDFVIKISGERFDLSEIIDGLRALKEVKDAAIRPIADGDTQSVKVLIVAAGDAAEALNAAKRWLATKTALAPHVARWSTAAAVPKSPLGKAIDW